MINYKSKEFIEDWKSSCLNSDGCTSGPFKYLARLFTKRNYRCFCRDHDFDYTYGWKYGVSRRLADKYLRAGIMASGRWHYPIAWAVWAAVRLFGSTHYRNS